MTDDRYVIERNLLLPEAKKWADEVTGPEPDKPGMARNKWYRKWNMAFLDKVDQLAREAGIVT